MNFARYVRKESKATAIYAVGFGLLAGLVLTYGMRIETLGDLLWAITAIFFGNLSGAFWREHADANSICEVLDELGIE